MAMGGAVGEQPPDADNADQEKTQDVAAEEADAAARRAFVRAVKSRGARS